MLSDFASLLDALYPLRDETRFENILTEQSIGVWAEATCENWYGAAGGTERSADARMRTRPWNIPDYDEVVMCSWRQTFRA